MCLAIPARVERIDGSVAEVDVGGVRRSISLWLTPEAQVGDYVTLHTGYAIGVLDQAVAQESLRLLRELAAIDGEGDAASAIGNIHRVVG
jgi:hydrogenase expression/formation protein HypC